MKFAAFDLETAKLLPEDVSDIKEYAPLGISCAAVAFSDKDDVIFWQGAPKLSIDDCKNLVGNLHSLMDEGYTLLTWNGCSFDFFVLAQESGLLEECGNIALNHVDLMMIVTFTKGYFLGLDKALSGAGIKGKVKKVTLSNGTKLSNMNGAQAPKLWADGEHQAVLEYLRADVTQLIELAKVVAQRKSIQWKSNSGSPQSVSVNKFYLAKECFNIPQPDVTWMDNPPSRKDFTNWIPSLKSPQRTTVNNQVTFPKVAEAPQKKKGNFILGCLGSVVAFFCIAISCGVLALPLDSALFNTPENESGPFMFIVSMFALAISFFVLIFFMTPNAKIWQSIKSGIKGLFSKKQ